VQFDATQVQQLVKLIESSGWDHARVETDSLTLVLSKGAPGEAAAVLAGLGSTAAPAAPPTPAAAPAAPPPPAPAPLPAAAAPAEPAAPAPVPPGSEVVTIDAPTVGTFYQAPKPDAPPFVRPGDRVQPDTTVCILEVMKLMNHVRAGVAGTVLEVFARNNELVEHGQPLMSVAVDRALTTAIEASSTPAA
jgi:acetyl-CoA carboxylase biotin carboxyl carrier protein